MKRWRIIARDVDGTLIAVIGHSVTRRGAERVRREWAHGIPQPIPNRPLYTVHVERLS